MSGNWFGQLCKRLLGGTSTARSTRGKPATARPRMEALEDRMVPNGNPIPDATGATFWLSTVDHRVYQSDPGPNGFYGAVASDISSLVRDGAGDVFALSFENHSVFEHIRGTTNWQFAGAWDISSLVSDANGDVLALSFGDNQVYEHVQGTLDSWNYANAYNISSLVSDANGDVYCLSFGDDHRVFHFNPGSLDWSDDGAYNVSSLVSDANGDIYALSSSAFGGNDQVYKHIQGTDWQYAGISNISSLVSDTRGDIFALSSGWLGGDDQVYQLGLGTTNWRYIFASNISTLVSNAAGDVFALSYGDNNVYELKDGGSDWTWQSVDSGVIELGVSGSGTLLADQNGVLQFSQTGQAGTWQASIYNDTTLGWFWVDSSGTVHAQTSDPNFFVNSTTGESYSWN
jgi:hypothetical protein